MTGDTRVELMLPRILEELGAGPIPDYTDSLLVRTSSMPQRRGWSFPHRWLPVDGLDRRIAARPAIPWRAVGLVVLLALALGVSAAIVGSQQPLLPDPLRPARNGLLAYSAATDIYVGDPATGTTTAIVTGLAADTGPIFSPDGTRIAFLRGAPWSDDVSIVVVRVDGSDERIVVPAGFSERWLEFAWTPDSASIVANHDSQPFTTPYFDGELSLLDASGVGDPRLLTPPLPIGPGGPYLDLHAPFAQMFRPPNADVILSGGTNALELLDLDLESTSELSSEGLRRLEPFSVAPWAVAWSPDGSMISLVLNFNDQDMGAFVMDADGTDVRGMHATGTWSPDSSKMAFERCSRDPEWPNAVIVVVDVATGAERILDATFVATKTEGLVPRRPLPIPASPDTEYCGWIDDRPNGRTWDYEGWSWSPDGRSIVMLERYGTHPIVVDVETGQATELPWVADSAPSWQRLPH